MLIVQVSGRGFGARSCTGQTGARSSGQIRTPLLLLLLEFAHSCGRWWLRRSGLLLLLLNGGRFAVA